MALSGHSTRQSERPLLTQSGHTSEARACSRVYCPALRALNLRTDARAKSQRGLAGWVRAESGPGPSQREIRAQDKLALEATRLETAVCFGDLIEGDPFGDARPDG